MNIYLGADHRGFQLKEDLQKYLESMGYSVIDLGNEQYEENDNYPEFASKVAEKVSKEAGARGIVICRSGAGVNIVANKFDGIRAAVINDKEQARLSRNDDDINVIALAADFLDLSMAMGICKVFLQTPFSGKERNKRRLDEIEEIEKDN